MCAAEAWHFHKEQPWQSGVHGGRILIVSLKYARRNRATRKHIPASRQDAHKNDAST
ncbi:hypothetical protein DPMN_129639 [Dreissena polymorpha]|uniref:Uncharacterized protein n=1 Tax=Dreissena polymorpha TaxID=45954 RepID=A0A9D4H597_DREPO|nr:hypothetical protein DPMN_129639 [Dreissena polymorpha]